MVGGVVTGVPTTQDFKRYGAGSVPKNALLQVAGPVTVFSTQRVRVPYRTSVAALTENAASSKARDYRGVSGAVGA